MVMILLNDDVVIIKVGIFCAILKFFCCRVSSWGIIIVGVIVLRINLIKENIIYIYSCMYCLNGN